MAGQRAFVNALRKALIERLIASGRFGRGLAQYGAITGGIGGGVGAGIGAATEDEEGDRWAGARDGFINGAAAGPVTVPAMVLGAASGLIPVAGTGLLAHTLWSGSEPAKRNRARQSLTEADAMREIVMAHHNSRELPYEAELRSMDARYRSTPTLREILSARMAEPPEDPFGAY